MSEYCLYPNQCGPGMDCSECYQKRIEELEAQLSEARKIVVKELIEHYSMMKWVENEDDPDKSDYEFATEAEVIKMLEG